MRCFGIGRGLAAIAALAALAASAVLAQAPALTPTEALVSPTTPTASDPPLPPTPEQVDDAMMIHRRYQAAIEAYKKAPRRSAEVWNKMGIAYQMMYNLDEAARCYKASLKIDSRNPRALNNLGSVYDSLKDCRAAERLYRKALKADPRSALIQKNLGTNLMAQRKFERGWQVYQAALAIDPKIFESATALKVDNPAPVQERGAMNYYMARGCARAGLTDCAIQYLSAALDEGFTNPRKIGADSEFAALRGIPAFQRLLAEQRNP